jgi:hypothetical protein
MEEEFVFFNRYDTYEEDGMHHIVVCESDEQGREYLMKEKGLKNPKLKEPEKIKRERNTKYPYYVMPLIPFHKLD